MPNQNQEILFYLPITKQRLEEYALVHFQQGTSYRGILYSFETLFDLKRSIGWCHNRCETGRAEREVEQTRVALCCDQQATCRRRQSEVCETACTQGVEQNRRQLPDRNERSEFVKVCWRGGRLGQKLYRRGQSIRFCVWIYKIYYETRGTLIYNGKTGA